MKYIIPFEKRPVKIGQGYNKGSHIKWSEERVDDTYSIDFLLRQGTKIIASRAGKVVNVKENGKINYSGRDLRKADKSYKHMNEIIIAHGDGNYANYCHLKNKGSFVKVGQKVEQGQVIGLSGNTGWSSAPHLHFSVFRKNVGNWKTKTIKINLDNKNL